MLHLDKSPPIRNPASWLSHFILKKTPEDFGQKNFYRICYCHPRVDRSLPASRIAHEAFCLASICRSYLTQLVFANWFFDRNVFCPLVDYQLYFAHSYFACGSLPVSTLPGCILPAEGKTLACEVHTGKIQWAKYDWQNTHGQCTRW